MRPDATTTPIFTILIANRLTADEKMTPAKIAGCLVGIVGTAVLIGPRLRSLGPYTAGDFLAARFGGILPRLAWAVIAFSVSLLLLVAHLKIAADLIGKIVPTTPPHALVAAAALTAFAALPGGMRSLTWTQAIQYFVIAVACLAPLGFLAWTQPAAETRAI